MEEGGGQRQRVYYGPNRLRYHTSFITYYKERESEARRCFPTVLRSAGSVHPMRSRRLWHAGCM